MDLKFPEPPTAPGPAATARAAAAVKGMAQSAAAHAAMPSADAHVDVAQAAVQQPPEETQGRASENLARELGEQPPPLFDVDEVLRSIREAIRERRPKNDAELAAADPQAAAQSAGQKLDQAVAGQAASAEHQYQPINQPAVAGASPAAGPTPAPASAVPKTAIDAAAAAPDALRPDQLSMSADIASSRAAIDQGGLNSPAAQLARSGPAADARTAQSEFEAEGQKSPAELLAQQKASLAHAMVDMASLQQSAADSLAAARKTTASAAHGGQIKFINTEEQLRTTLSKKAETIVNDTRGLVRPLLERLNREPRQKWDAGVQLASQQFKQHLAAVEQKRKETYGDGLVGEVTEAAARLVNFFESNKFWVEKEYDTAEELFILAIADLLKTISGDVAALAEACRQIIKEGHKQLAQLYGESIPAHLRKTAEAERARFAEMLDGLSGEITQARDGFHKDLTTRARDAVMEVHDLVNAAREKARGFLGRIQNAVAAFLENPAKAIFDGLLELVGIPPAEFYALIGKIRHVFDGIAKDVLGFASSLLDAVGKGFEMFFENIGGHLIQGLLDWLFAGLKSVGVDKPKDLSLKSVITFFLQLLGVTWKRVRELLAKHIGEKNIALIERVWSTLEPLFTLGPSGLFNMLKEQLNPKQLLDMVLDMAKDFVIQGLIKRVAARLALMFNPVGAIAQAVEAIYRVLKWLFVNAARLFRLVETIVNGAAAIVRHDIAGTAALIEKALAMTLPPVIDFLAEYMGLGDLPDKVAEHVEKLHDWIYQQMDKVIGWLVERGKELLAAIGIGKKDKKDPKAYDGEVGKTVTFTAGSEVHKLWLEPTGDGFTLVMASEKKGLNEHLVLYEIEANKWEEPTRTQLLDLIAKARQLEKETLAAAAAAKEAAFHAAEAPSAAKSADDKAEAREETTAGAVKSIMNGLMEIIPAEALEIQSGDVVAKIGSLEEFKVLQTRVEFRQDPHPPAKGIKIKASKIISLPSKGSHHGAATAMLFYQNFKTKNGWELRKSVDDQELRSQTPDADATAYVLRVSPVCTVYTEKPDPIRADHLVSFARIIRLPGFRNLTLEDKLKVINLEQNFVSLGARANSSKGERSFSEWEGLPREPIPPSTRERLLVLEAKALVLIMNAIREGQ